jgi:hypothetical protein
VALGGGTLCPRGQRLHMWRRFAAGRWGGAERTVARYGRWGSGSAAGDLPPVVDGDSGEVGLINASTRWIWCGRLLGNNWSPPGSEISVGKEPVLAIESTIPPMLPHDHGTAERQTSGPQLYL